MCIGEKMHHMRQEIQAALQQAGMLLNEMRQGQEKRETETEL